MPREHVEPEWGSKTANGRRQPLLGKETVESSRFGEVAGVTTVECAAVCCCPCALVNLFVLTCVKLPAVLCKKALRETKRKRTKKNRVLQGNGKQETVLNVSFVSSQEELLDFSPGKDIVIVEGTPVATENFWEEFMEKVHVGFWRNPSFKE